MTNKKESLLQLQMEMCSSMGKSCDDCEVGFSCLMSREIFEEYDENIDNLYRFNRNGKKIYIDKPIPQSEFKKIIGGR
jgi:hypothetical protein